MNIEEEPLLIYILLAMPCTPVLIHLTCVCGMKKKKKGWRNSVVVAKHSPRNLPAFDDFDVTVYRLFISLTFLHDSVVFTPPLNLLSPPYFPKLNQIPPSTIYTPAFQPGFTARFSIFSPRALILIITPATQTCVTPPPPHPL